MAISTAKTAHRSFYRNKYAVNLDALQTVDQTVYASVQSDDPDAHIIALHGGMYWETHAPIYGDVEDVAMSQSEVDAILDRYSDLDEMLPRDILFMGLRKSAAMNVLVTRRDGKRLMRAA